MPEVTMEEMIELVRSQRLSREPSEPMQPPCPQIEIDRLRNDIPARLNGAAPERYLDLLRISNGISTEGPMIYGSRETLNAASDVLGIKLILPGIIEENEGLRLDRPEYHRLILFGSSSLYVHALDMDTGKYIFFPHIGNRPDETYDTFDQMMISTLWLGLDEEFRPNPWKRNRPRW